MGIIWQALKPTPLRLRNREGVYEIFEHHKDNAGEHRWRLTCEANGEIIQTSHEGYSSLKGCLENARKILFLGRTIERAKGE